MCTSREFVRSNEVCFLRRRSRFAQSRAITTLRHEVKLRMRPMLPAPRARHIPKDLIDMPITTRGKRLPLPQFACPCGSERGSTIVCDGCDATFHLRCLHRKRMPVGLWFCSSCNDSRAQDLEERIPDSLKARLGEVCWVDWGDGFGWWPCIVCHPLWMKGKAVDEAFAMASEYLLVNF